MNKRLLVAGIILAVAVAGIIFTMGIQTGATHLQPAEYKAKMASGSLRSGEPIKMVGTVTKGSIKRDGNKVNFVIEDKKAKVEVEYEGAVPDGFESGRDVILEGTYSGEPFVATKLIAKCPSKYQARKEK